MTNEVIKQDRDKMALFKKYGYDVSASIRSVISKAGRIKGSMLEIGTGRGHMAAALARKGFKFTSIDLDKNGQNIARQQLESIGRARSVTMKIMDAENLRFKDNAFDCVVSFNFIHHAKDPARCIREMIRVAGNKLIICDINIRGRSIMYKVHKLNGQEHEVSKITAKATAALLRRAGTLKSYRDPCQNIYILTKPSK